MSNTGVEMIVAREYARRFVRVIAMMDGHVTSATERHISALAPNTIQQHATDTCLMMYVHMGVSARVLVHLYP